MELKDINSVLADVNKLYKSPMFTAMGDPNANKSDIERVPTGRLPLDLVMGGGTPIGRIIELFGMESSGKTTIALHMVAAMQQAFPDKFAVFVDYEHAIDKNYAADLGVDIDKLVLAQPSFLEEGMEGVDQLIGSGKASIIVVDSVAAMTPKSELEGDMDQSSIGVQAKLLNKVMRKITGKANQTGTTVVFINQLREKIGVMFGNPWVTTGGNALKFYSSIRLEVRKGTKNKEKDGSTSGNHGKLIGVKNKTYTPYKEYEFDIDFGLGVSRESAILDIGAASGLITKKGSWFYYYEDLEDESTKITIGNGKDKAKEFLKDNAEFADGLEKAILELMI